jgi:hypothetical protein
VKTKLVQIIFKDSVRTSNRTPHFTITKINLLTLFKKIIDVYIETHKRPITTECTITDWWSRWVVHIVATRLLRVKQTWRKETSAVRNTLFVQAHSEICWLPVLCIIWSEPWILCPSASNFALWPSVHTVVIVQLGNAAAPRLVGALNETTPETSEAVNCLVGLLFFPLKVGRV